MITLIVGNMHVSTTYKEIVAEFRRRMRDKNGFKTAYTDRAVRKSIYRQAIDIHKANVATYLAVMRGF